MKWVKTVLTHIFEGANAAVVILLWAAAGASYISPESYPRLSLLTLAFPVFLLTDVAFIVFWLVFKARRVWIPLAGIACCLSFVRDYAPLNLPSAPPDTSLVVLSFNTHNFGGKEAVDSAGNRLMFPYFTHAGADIICLQESDPRSFGQVLIDSMEALGYEHVCHKSLILFSRLHVIDSDTLIFHTSNNSGSWAKLEWGSDTILLINNHFESTHISIESRQKLAEAMDLTTAPPLTTGLGDTLRKDFRPLLAMLAESAPLRAKQADLVDSIVAAWLPRPVIVCGDFNDTPVSYTHRLLTRRLTSAFRQSGNGPGLSFRERGFPVRIDHILFSPQHWRSYSTHVDRQMNLSDHRPISTVLAPKASQ